ncbi:hypothetical protein JMN32_18325 [Fulvivirga sp. 29W222]|uniref:Uncharacterized protein n=1 Tax=Fulvivirga marina TaxID=2494733 RepID=A0A937KD63_9BACT|nr:hypothetical protein [Fulvivirga marina]MBL6448277.1 hypothetical protein [Fulvivirga marina]
MESTAKNIITWMLCLSTITIAIYWFSIAGMLILLPFILIYIALKLPVSKSIVFDSRIRYQMLDISQGDFIRNGIELLLGHKKVFLADPPEILKWVYVANDDFNKLWPESPFDMDQRNYTIRARFKTYRLLLGGYASAKVIHIEKIEECPLITK